MRTEDSYGAGEKALYNGEGHILVVEILKNKSDKDFIGYKLRTLDGEEFYCLKRREEVPGALWRLEEIAESGEK